MKIVVTDRNRNKHTLDALDGWRVMEIIRDYGMRDAALGLKAECGGALSCATCHVYVGAKWQEKLPPATDEEQDMLDAAFEVEDNSRLSCQILMNDDLDGLEITLAPGSEP
ncbi:MAG: 2Fe-2S iron-sulfur cluster-binding protein [Alphaproteobacteria bacterium]|nr:2Fe-2S iron-sulfur cluster-binding protein [Alphaproteobacteria bacterium]